MNKKAQEAMEFLTTYAWAILAMGIAIGALFYFGAFDMSKFSTSKCAFTNQFGCEDFILQSDKVKLRMKNNLGKEIYVTSLAVRSENDKSFSCEAFYPFYWSKDSQKNITVFACSGNSYEPSEKVELRVEMRYYATDSKSKTPHTIQGLLRGKIESLSDNITMCKVTTGGCSGLVLLKASSAAGGHAELAGGANYNYKVCCSSPEYTFGNNCLTGFTVLKLSAATNAHVEENTYSNYPQDLCLSASQGTMECIYTDSDCLEKGYNICAATISKSQNAIVAGCTNSTFTRKICCRVR